MPSFQHRLEDKVLKVAASLDWITSIMRGETEKVPVWVPSFWWFWGGHVLHVLNAIGSDKLNSDQWA